MIYSSGQDLKSINNRAYAKYNTGKAEKIVIALDKCGIPYFARFNDAEISLTYDNGRRYERFNERRLFALYKADRKLFSQP